MAKIAVIINVQNAYILSCSVFFHFFLEYDTDPSGNEKIYSGFSVNHVKAYFIPKSSYRCNYNIREALKPLY